MNKRFFHTLNDMLLLIAFIGAAVSGLVLKFILVRGMGKINLDHPSFLMLTRDSWLTIHDITGILMIIFTLIHVLLYWKVFMALIKGTFRKK